MNSLLMRGQMMVSAIKHVKAGMRSNLKSQDPDLQPGTQLEDTMTTSKDHKPALRPREPDSVVA